MVTKKMLKSPSRDWRAFTIAFAIADFIYTVEIKWRQRTLQNFQEVSNESSCNVK